LNHKESALAVIDGRSNGLIPSQIDFTPSQIKKLTGLQNISEDELMDQAGNCIKYINSLGNVEEYFNPDVTDEGMKQFAIDKGFAKVDPERKTVFDLFGVGWDIQSEGVNPKVHPLQDMASYNSYHWPVPGDRDMMKYGKSAVQKYRDQYFLLGFQHIGLFERCWCLRGYENFMCDLMLEPDFVEEMLDNILKYKLAEAQMYVNLGVNAVRLGDDWGLQKGLQISPQHWRKFIKPRQEKLYRFYHEAGLPTFQHSCGDISSIIPDLIEIGLNVLHPIQPLSMDIAELAERYGKQLTFWGGVDTQEVLPYWEPEAIKCEVKRVFGILGRNRKYIIAPSQEVMSDVRPENVAALIEGIRECKIGGNF
jgi:uroporphyrinogen decarboxylase